MPFKTKKQKEAAKNRRIIFSKNALISYTKENVATLSGVPQTSVNDTKAIGLVDKDYSYIRSDLVRILFLSSVIIIAQIVLWAFHTKLPIPLLKIP